MSKYIKIVITLSVITAIALSIGLYTSYQRLWAVNVEGFKSETESFIQNKIATQLDLAIFSDQDQERQKKDFENFWKDIQSVDYVRIKVWDANYTVLWSNFSDIIGKSFPDNHEVAEALDGEVEFEIAKLSQENVFERQYKELSETYIPVKNSEGEVIGVVEIYRPMVSLKEEIFKEFQKQLVVAIPLALLSFVLVAYLLRFAIKKPRPAA